MNSFLEVVVFIAVYIIVLGLLALQFLFLFVNSMAMLPDPRETEWYWPFLLFAPLIILVIFFAGCLWWRRSKPTGLKVRAN